MNDTCSSFEGCKAPICPMDNSFNQAVWYADEDICKSYKYRKEHWRKIQVRVKRVNTITPVDGCFSLYMLEGIKRVMRGIAGKNPNRVSKPRK